MAHIGYFLDEYVNRKKWLSEKQFTDFVALCQFLPGPASSQLGICIGSLRAGILGGLLTWLGFTLPSALLLSAFAAWVKIGSLDQTHRLQGLKIVALVIVAHASLSLWKKLVKGGFLTSITLISFFLLVFFPSNYTQLGVLTLSGLLGLTLYPKKECHPIHNLNLLHTHSVNQRLSIFCLLLFVFFLFFPPLFGYLYKSDILTLFNIFYRSGSLVFGGGHVILPLLQNELLSQELINQKAFFAGYGLTQAIPGPLFTFSSYIGTYIYGWWGGILALFAIFLPGYLLIMGVLPFWARIQNFPRAYTVLSCLNASVVGILLASLYNPLFTSAILSFRHLIGAVILFCLLTWGKSPPWIIVLLGFLGGLLL